jgi:hypothetical protein
LLRPYIAVIINLIKIQGKGVQNLKKYLFILAVLALVVMISGCTTTSTINTKNFSTSGMSFQYPDTWNVSSQVTNNSTQIMVASSEFISSNATKGSMVLILKIPKSGDNNMSQTRQELMTQAQQSGQNATNATINIAGVTASDISYTGKDTTGNNTYGRLIDFEKNDSLYLLLFASGGGADINAAKPYFDVIVKSFKVE